MGSQPERIHQRPDIEPVVKWRLKKTAGFDIRSKLAITAAYEYLTTTMGDLLFERPEWLEGSHETLRLSWTWHAAEECEHRSLAHDVCCAAGGGYVRRTGWFVWISLIFAIDAIIQTLHNLSRAGDLFRLKTWIDGTGFLFGRKGMAWPFASAWMDYLRPGFRPSDRGDEQMIREWLAGHAVWFR